MARAARRDGGQRSSARSARAGDATTLVPERAAPTGRSSWRASARVSRRREKRARVEGPGARVPSVRAGAAQGRGRRRLAWEDPVDRVSGLGPASREALAKLGTTTVADLVWTLPVAWDDARRSLVAEAIARAQAAPLGARVCLHGGREERRARSDAWEARSAGRRGGRGGRFREAGFGRRVVVLRRPRRARSRHARGAT